MYMSQKEQFWPSNEELDFVNSGGDILEISNPPQHVIDRITREMRERKWADEETIQKLVEAVSE
jgi:hypothetical protein